MRKAVTHILKFGAIGLVVAAAAIVLVGFLVMWLWNWLMPDIFGLPVIGVWHALGLLLLGHLLVSRS